MKNEKKFQQELYVSPELEVIETQMQTVICLSNTETPTEVSDPEWNWE